MKTLLGLFALMLALLGTPSWAAEPQTAAQVQLSLIKQMEKDGYLSTKLAQEAKDKYVDAKGLAGPALAATAAAKSEPSFIERYITLTNALKVIGVAILVIWFWRGILKMVFLIVAVPKELYQTVFLAAGVTATVAPELIWASQAFYLALFGSIVNLIVLGWILATHPKLEAFVANLFQLGVHPSTVLSFYGMLYFGALALHYQSELFGFAAAVCLSGVFSFTMNYHPGVLSMSARKEAWPAVVFGHLAVLGLYVGLKLTGSLPDQAQYFAIGLEFYCTIAMGVGFLVQASPYEFARMSSARTSTAGYAALFIALLAAALTGYTMYDLKAIGSIICVIAVLLALEWIGYYSYKVGFMTCTFVMGVSLFGLALLMERYGDLLILRLA